MMALGGALVLSIFLTGLYARHESDDDGPIVDKHVDDMSPSSIGGPRGTSSSLMTTAREVVREKASRCFTEFPSTIGHGRTGNCCL